MCFTEFLGYTCGHTSIPVERPCPMTTQSHLNPVCPSPACRPLLAFTMCPSCARIVHARWVDIIIYEHQFMHARGVCHCPVRFPHLQQPRVLSHYIDDVDDEEGASREAFAEHFRRQVKSQMAAQGTEQKATGSNSSSPTIILGPVAKQQSSSLANRAFHLSASAAEFMPGTSAVNSLSQPAPPFTIQELLGITTSSDYSAPGPSLNAPATIGSSRNTRFEPGMASHILNKSKGKEVAVQKERNDHVQHHHHHNNSNGNFAPQPYTSHKPTSSTAGASTATSHEPTVPPMFSTREGPGQQLEIATRLPSQYGAEWITEHKQRHERGQCSCRCSFDKYPAQYAHMLAEATPEDLANRTEATFPDFGVSREFAAKPDTSDAAALGAYRPRRDDDAACGTPGFHTDGHVPAPANTPAEVVNQHPFPYSVNFDEELSEAMRHHFPPTPDPTAAPAAHLPPVPAPTQNPYDADVWKWHLPPNPTEGPLPRGYRPDVYGVPARWACSPPNDSTSDGNAQGSMMQALRPIDMQILAYNVGDVPLMGLPIGAGPEGDSHMPPFEDCELYYPKLSDDQRPATASF